MTRQSSFKKRIRERMQRTGERYAAARQSLLQQATASQSRIAPVDGASPLIGVHGDSARLTSSLAQAGVQNPATDAPFSEAVVFALTGGINFMYFLFEYKDVPPLLTFVCRSWSMPWPLVERVLSHAEIEHDVTETSSAAKAKRALDAALDTGHVAHLTVDAASLPWTGTEPEWKGQIPRQINVIGREGETYLVDDGTWREVEASVLADARTAVRKQKNRLVTFAGKANASPVQMARAAAHYTAQSFVEAPFKGFASNFGLAGLGKAAKLMSTSKDKKSWPKVFSSSALAFRALYRTWECATLDFTPPAGGRHFYADGLEQLAEQSGLKNLRDAAELARESGRIFEAVADDAIALGGPSVEAAVALSEEIDELARAGDAPDRIRKLRQQRSELAKDATLDSEERLRAFAQLGSHFEEIRKIEGRLVEVLRTI